MNVISQVTVSIWKRFSALCSFAMVEGIESICFFPNWKLL